MGLGMSVLFFWDGCVCISTAASLLSRLPHVYSRLTLRMAKWGPFRSSTATARGAVTRLCASCACVLVRSVVCLLRDWASHGRYLPRCQITQSWHRETGLSIVHTETYLSCDGVACGLVSAVCAAVFTNPLEIAKVPITRIIAHICVCVSLDSRLCLSSPVPLACAFFGR